MLFDYKIKKMNVRKIRYFSSEIMLKITVGERLFLVKSQITNVAYTNRLSPKNEHSHSSDYI